MISLTGATWSLVEIPYEDLTTTPAAISELGWVQRGVARLEPGPLGWRLQIGPYVGRLVLPGYAVVDVEDLVPGTVEALLPYASTGIRTHLEPSPSGPPKMPPWASLLGQFALELRAYVQEGLDRRYVERHRNTPYPRGRIDLKRSIIRNRARGRSDLLACAYREITDDTALNQALLLAARSTERALRSTAFSDALRATRVALQPMAGVQYAPAVDVRAARSLALATGRRRVQLLVELAEVIIGGVSAPSGSETSDQPVSVWINVESLFEQAVRHVLAELLTSDLVRAGRGDGTLLLSGGETLEADPDVVIEHDSGSVILDAKYRRHGADVSRDEMYQLMAHSDAYRARIAALVVPRLSDADEDRLLGFDSRGCRYEVVVVDANDRDSFRSRLAAWLDHAGLPAMLATPPPATSMPAFA